MQSIDVYGWIGYEMAIDNHIKTRVFFSIVDQKQTQLAWFMFSQDMVVPRWQDAFDLAGLGDRKLDRNTAFGEALPYPTLNDVPVDFSKLAPRMSRPGAFAHLDMSDRKRDKTTTCKVRWRTESHNAVKLQFELSTIAQRRTFDITKTGRVWLLGIEKFSLRALKRGIRGATTLTGGSDPHSPIL